jgi:hypothetical protein
MLADPRLKGMGFRKLVTHATRPPRKGEVEGYSYYFISTERMKEMELSGELAERPTPTGNSLKATSKGELLKVVEDSEKLIWRIDLSRAAEIVGGGFFTGLFDPDLAGAFEKCTKVYLIVAGQATLELRRKLRDGVNYDPNEYVKRDQDDLGVLKKSRPLFTRKIINPQGNLEEAVEQIINDLLK